MFTARYTGEVHFLPPEESPGGDPKSRRHVLLTDCHTDDVIATVAYCSTRASEAARGAKYHLIDPAKTRYKGTGFDRPTFIYLARLISILGEELVDDPAGRLIDDMVPMRERLGEALGLGTGTGAEGTALGSLRGQIVTLAPELADGVDTNLALVLTEPQYSRERRYQIIVPMYDVAEFEENDLDVVVSSAPWLLKLGCGYSVGMLAVPLVQTAFHPEDVVDLTGVVVDSVTIHQVDEALKYHFHI
jgi:hypothetical protein